MAVPRKVSSLVLLRRDNSVLLGYKKRGFGAGKWNGFGGKKEEGETMYQCAKRELLEESGLVSDSLKEVGKLEFEFVQDPMFMDVTVYTTRYFTGEPRETEDLLLRKFNNLKTYYRRERKRYFNLKSGSAGISFQPRWEHFARLGFLADSCVAEQSRSNIVFPDTPVIINSQTLEELSPVIDEDESIESSFVDANTPDVHSLFESTPNVHSLTERAPNVTPNGRKRKRQAGEALSELTTCLKSLNEAKEDAEDAFGRYIAMELKCIKDRPKRDLAKLKIQSLLYDCKYGSE